MLIALDAGHGLNTLGKRCMKAIDPNQTKEWVLNSRIAEKVEALLAGYNCEVLRVDDRTGKKDVSLSQRVKAANNAKATVYVSIHHNAGIKGGTGGGIVIFAAVSCSQKPKELQKAVYTATVEKTGLKGNRSNPMPEKNYYVVKYTKMPAILGEFGFMDSAKDTPIILTDSFAQKAAEGIVEGLVAVLNLTKKEANTTTETGGAKTVTITLPVLRKGDKGAAVTSMQQLLTAKGYSTKGADGIFGANTETALKKYQAAKGLEPDAICGEQSWTALLK